MVRERSRKPATSVMGSSRNKNLDIEKIGVSLWGEEYALVMYAFFREGAGLPYIAL